MKCILERGPLYPDRVLLPFVGSFSLSGWLVILSGIFQRSKTSHCAE